MKKVNTSDIKMKINEAVAKVTLKAAIKGAGFPSKYGWHQPKVPDRLTK